MIKDNNGKIHLNMAMISVTAVSVVIMAAFHFQSMELKNEIQDYHNKTAVIEEKIDEENARTQQIDQLEEYMQTDEFAKEIANERLGLVGDDQIIFKENP